MRRAQWLLAAMAGAVAGCGGASPSSGVTAMLRLSDAQFIPGALEIVNDVPGPLVGNIMSNNTRVFPGAQGRVLSGDVGAGATALLVGLGGDNAHWGLPVGVEDLTAPGNYVFQTRLSFSPEIPLGDQSLIFRAVDAHGQVGPAQVLALKVESPLPTGALVISLQWDTESDLDLHVQVPNVTDPAAPYEVWAKSPTALPPRSSNDQPPTRDELMAAGQLDVDSNGQCVIDGRRQEDLVFPQAPPPGAYTVRVDAFSLCGQATARWHAVAVAGDSTLGEAFGQMTDFDTSRAHTGGAGTLAFSFSIPQ